jgi:hypothetical protein
LSAEASMVVVTVKGIGLSSWTRESPNPTRRSMVPAWPRAAAEPLKMVIAPDVMLTVIFEHRSVAVPEVAEAD